MTMRTQMRNMKRRVQRGFTLVELAIVLVIAGLILVAVLRGTDAIQKAQVERMVSDLRGMQGILLEFQKRNGRLPGDCDNNGVLSNAVNVPRTVVYLSNQTQTASAPGVLDITPDNRVMPADPVDTGANLTCTDSNPAREADINLVWNELRRSGVVDANRLPRELARHSMGDVFLVSTMFDDDAPPNHTAMAGVIVVYGIPVWMAEAVDASIDGAATLYGADDTATGPANTGRVRLWSPGPGATTAPVGVGNVFATGIAENGSYDGGNRDRDRLISISFQYTPNKLIR